MVDKGRKRRALRHGLALGLTLPVLLTNVAKAEEAFELPEIKVVSTAEDELKQAPGVSIITAEDIKKQPIANDISEIVRKMPGVNLSGNSSSGQYGNNRQIDLRGMGPENTLILIDGKPVRSRNSTRMGSSGERNSRGDSNWVPVEAIERIEVIRGPAAARYGNGAAGGVVNIITKKTTDEPSGSLTLYGLQPENSDEGNTRRATFNLMTPLVDTVSMRLYGNIARTTEDSLDLNRQPDGTTFAGREGVENKDIDALFRWEPVPKQAIELDMGFSRQGNLYAGEQAVNSVIQPQSLSQVGDETNVVIRRNTSLTHTGNWDFGDTRLMLQYEGTNNKRLNEGMWGGPEGTFTSEPERSTTTLRNYTAAGEVNIPLDILAQQRVTLGAEYQGEKLNDPYAATNLANYSQYLPDRYTSVGDPSKNDAQIYSAFVEDNIQLTYHWLLTPGIRLDYHSEFGANLSPSLNTAYEILDGLSVKGGIARAFKAPNLYQSNDGYLYFSRGNGCPLSLSSNTGNCLILGNSDLKPETSINKEVGLGYDKNGWASSLTFFHNKYDDKIVANTEPVYSSSTGGSMGNGLYLMRWDNAKNATIYGFEGNMLAPLSSDVSWNTNFTYMMKNEDDDGNPLSLVPKYTINSSLFWQATEDLSFTLGVTRYGKQEPRQTVNNRTEAANGINTDARKPYVLVDFSSSYDLFDSGATVSFGVRNLLDKQILRSGNNSRSGGGNVYNEPGRAYYLSLTTQF